MLLVFIVQVDLLDQVDELLGRVWLSRLIMAYCVVPGHPQVDELVDAASNV